MTGQAPIRVAIVDDSAFMRIALRQMLGRSPDVEIVAEGRNGREAIEIAQREQPDLMTLDVLMPELNGLEALAGIMESAPCPVLMISTETQQGAETTMRALDLGAVDFIAKTTDMATLDMAWIGNKLIEKVTYWARQNRPAQRVRKVPEQAVLRSVEELARVPDMIVIAASTGGPRAITELVGGMRAPLCPVVVAQHMPEGFTEDFARHVALRSGHQVVEVQSGGEILPGGMTILEGGVDSEVKRSQAGRFEVMTRGTHQGVVHPSADLLMQSVAEHCKLAAAVILTGMGDDGVVGSRLFAAKGWPVLAQEPASCVVAGMPGAVIAAGMATAVLPIAGIARQLNRWAVPRKGPGGRHG
ncbi:MAG: chemotaxis-specific protein-glutamate methyltransferase CheB [Alphaproteobacteria bacterium]|nr:chemotaxis-specific protein-glutamate methyltransferase CheB [Alphaproteobacteria bacterium]